MLTIYGKSSCEDCINRLKQLDEEGVKYRYYDLGTKEGLASALMNGILSKDRKLPFEIEEDTHIIG